MPSACESAPHHRCPLGLQIASEHTPRFHRVAAPSVGVGVIAIVGGSIYTAMTQEPPSPPAPPPEVCEEKATPDEYGYPPENFVGGAQS